VVIRRTSRGCPCRARTDPPDAVDVRAWVLLRLRGCLLAEIGHLAGQIAQFSDKAARDS